MAYTPNPFHLVDKADQMARRAKGGNAMAFEKIATVSMCVVAVTAGMQMLMQLWRELRRDDNRSPHR